MPPQPPRVGVFFEQQVSHRLVAHLLSGRSGSCCTTTAPYSRGFLPPEMHAFCDRRPTDGAADREFTTSPRRRRHVQGETGGFGRTTVARSHSRKQVPVDSSEGGDHGPHFGPRGRAELRLKGATTTLPHGTGGAGQAPDLSRAGP
jgi:hypothetical protein